MPEAVAQGDYTAKGKIFPLSAFEQIHAAQTICENGKIRVLVYRAVFTR